MPSALSRARNFKSGHYHLLCTRAECVHTSAMSTLSAFGPVCSAANRLRSSANLFCTEVTPEGSQRQATRRRAQSLQPLRSVRCSAGRTESNPAQGVVLW
jgi:hypothetical protein